MKRLVLVLALLWPVSLLADLQAGLDAYDRKDYATAYREFLPLAEQGNAKAQYYLGRMYYVPEGVSRNITESIRWYRLAAEQDYARAQFTLGFRYSTGEGVPQDYAEAIRWYRLAAEQGYSSAQYNLGRMYYKGKDYVQAYAWFNVLGAREDEGAIVQRDFILNLMTPAQIAEGQKLSRELFERLKK